jgi:hypothetical protein
MANPFSLNRARQFRKLALVALPLPASGLAKQEMKNAVMYMLLILSMPLADSAVAESSTSATAPSQQPACAKVKDTAAKRAVPRVVEPPPTMPLAPIAAPHAAPPAVAVQPTKPLAPTPVTGCDPGGCRDTGGNRYNGATGNTYLDQNGKPCNRTGTWVQCF